MKTSKFGEINKFFQSRYKRLIIVSLGAAIISAAVLNIFASNIMSYFGGSETSIQIMRYVAIRNIVLSVFVANISTLMFLNKAKTLSIIAISCTLVVIVAGGVLAHYGFANIVLGYLISANMVAGLSTLCVGV